MLLVYETSLCYDNVRETDGNGKPQYINSEQAVISEYRFWVQTPEDLDNLRVAAEKKLSKAHNKKCSLNFSFIEMQDVQGIPGKQVAYPIDEKRTVLFSNVLPDFLQ